ncbi:MAG TPA: histidine phosphatase family protein, partial [Pseudomonadales bacterium]|nr:histidine phosphatase family protein [Pseudomonadales bacterium]
LRQVAAHLSWLRAVPPDLIVASPLGRVRHTAAILATGLAAAGPGDAGEAVPLRPVFDDALRERSMGIFDGRTLDEIERSHPDEHAAREADPWSYRAPGGENYDDLMARTGPLLARLLRHPARRVLVVSHGTLARPLLGGLLGLERARILRLRAPNDVAYRIRLGPPPRIEHHRGEARGEGLIWMDEG